MSKEVEKIFKKTSQEEYDRRFLEVCFLQLKEVSKEIQMKDLFRDAYQDFKES